MRLRVASDRVFRTVAKTVDIPSTATASRSRKSSGRAHRSLAATLRDCALLLGSLLFLLHSAYSAWGGGSYDPQAAWQWRVPGGSTVVAVTACADADLLRATQSGLRAAKIALGAAVPANFSYASPSSTLLAGAWAPSAALNLAAARAHADWLLLLPCGCEPPTLPHPPASGTLYATGTPSSGGDICALTTLVQKAAFFSVRGFDERIAGPWDPSLRARLVATGLRPGTLPTTTDASPYNPTDHVAFVTDSLLQRGAPAWDAKPSPPPAAQPDKFEASQAARSLRRAARARIATTYRVLRGGSHEPVRRALPLAALHVAGAPERARVLATRESLRGRYGLPRAVSVGLSAPALSRLHAALAAAESGRHRPTFVVAHVQHGLGNRLRALGSAIAYARATGRVLVVVWERDGHCEARFEALFAPAQLFVSGIGPRKLADAARADDAWGSWALFDYMKAGVKDAPVAAPEDRSVYFRSAYALRSEPRALATWAVANAAVRKLKPAAEVEALAPPEAAGMIGVHVRARPVEGEVAGARYDSNATRILGYWRRKSAPANFAAKMALIRTQNPKARFLVAADTDNARAELRKVPGATVLNGCEGRGEHCVQHAFAEMRALADTYHLLGSPWSSFSEAVVRLGGMHMESAGIDFAVDDVQTVREKVGADVADVLQEVLKRREAKLKRLKTKKFHF